MTSAILAIPLAVVIGFATHRASLCNVKAVGELLSSRRAYMLGSFVKTVLWVVAITMAIGWILPSGSSRAIQSWAFSYRALAGGFIFGVGAAINGGCALGTLGRLGKGELRMVVTLIGLVLGLAAAGHGQVRRWLASPETADRGYSFQPVLTIVIGTTLSLWVLWEIRALWRKRDRDLSWTQTLLARRYRLSTAAMLLGLANGSIYALHGAWSYTRSARKAVNHVVVGEPGPAIFFWLLFAAVLAGVLISSLLNKSFSLEWRVRIGWLRNLTGGILMGVGVSLTPGGNDVLILHSIPSGSPHALPAYAALLIGTAAGLVVYRSLAGDTERIECTGDICRTRPESIG